MRKRWLEFLLCFVLSASIWLIHVLGQPYSDIVSVPVNVRSNIEGRAEYSNGSVIISARVSSESIRLITKSMKRKTSSVFIDSGDLEHIGGDNFRISSSNLYKYAQRIYGDAFTVENFITGSVDIRFSPEQCVKVPVLPVCSASYKPQYMARGDVKVYPDSVLVYGEPARLGMLNAIYTRQISLSDIDNSVHGVARIEVPSGLRVSVDEVTYTIDVGRYVEIRSAVNVLSRNVPAGTDFTVLPSVAEVIYKCEFPLVADPVATAEFFVDYRDFQSSIAGKCLVHWEGLPEGVISVTVVPQVFECVENHTVLQ